MNKHLLSIALAFTAFILLLPSGTGIINRPQNTGSAYPTTTIYVDDSNTQGPWNGTHDYPYETISDGLAHASNGDTVYVLNGVYNETVTVNKTIYFRGQQQSNTIIDGGNNGTVVHITADNVLMRLFTVRNAGGHPEDAAVRIDANTTTVSDCILYRTRTAVLMENKNDLTVTNCQFQTNGFGIAVEHSSYLTVNQCTFYHNAIGIYVYDTHVAAITSAYLTTNGIGFLGERSSNIEIDHSAASDNNDNEGGMFFTDSLYITVHDCNFENDGVGVNLVGCTTCYIDQCTFSKNTHFACKLMESLTSIILTHCLFTQNLRYGIYAQNSALEVTWSNFEQDAVYGIWENSTLVNAPYNYWSSLTGPAHTGLRRADRANWDPRNTVYSPWLTFPMPDSGTDWQTDKIFSPPINITTWPEHLSLPGNDTDGDGAPDWWEQQWGYNPLVYDDHAHLDPDGDGLNNLEECSMADDNARPFYKDVFLEFDWMRAGNDTITNKPQPTNVSVMIAAFAAHNITLHVDTGNLGGGEEIPTMPFVSYADIVNLYWEYFLHDDLNNPRQRIFHYGLICDKGAGPGFAVFGWNNLNAFFIGAQQLLDNNYPHYSRDWLIVCGSMHELGHTFGLVVKRFNGIDNQAAEKPYFVEFWRYLGYRSVLNYLYTYSFLDYSDGSHGRNDFNDWGNIDFSFFKNTDFHSLG